MRNYEYLMDKTVARETPVVYPPGTARAARALMGHMRADIILLGPHFATVCPETC